MHPLEVWLKDQKEKGERITRRELAKRVGCSPAWLTEIIQDGGTPSLALCARFNQITGIPIEKFVRD